MSSPEPPSLFPPQTASYILAFQFSSWYAAFSALSIRSTIIRPLSQEFREYLDADGVFVPEGSEDVPPESTLDDDSSDNHDGDDDDEEDDDDTPTFAFPDLDAQIRTCIQSYGGVFPKLNFSSPRDAAWMLPASSPLKCTTPADVYLLLKSSDFIAHDLSPALVFAGCPDSPAASTYTLELILRKWYPVDRSRELRCFVRHSRLLGISQRDTNYYEFLNDPPTHAGITRAVHRFWAAHIRAAPYWCDHNITDYTFDLLLTRDLTRAHIVDFNPYAPRTDPLLFTYDELAVLLAPTEDGTLPPLLPPPRVSVDADTDTDTDTAPLPEFRMIDSRAHPAAASRAPAHQHNMLPFEALSLSSGRDIEEFAGVWAESVREAGRGE